MSDMNMTIDEEIKRLGPLEIVGAAIVDYVKAGAGWGKSTSQFQHYSQGWTMEPDNWINLCFVHTRKHRIHVSLGVYTTTLEPMQDGLMVKQGQRPTWSRITIDNRMQLPAALLYIERAYYKSDNGYRTKIGTKPDRPGATSGRACHVTDYVP